MQLLDRLFSYPAPTHRNVIPAGEGWYCYALLRGRWQRVDGKRPGARWLSRHALFCLAVDAARALAGRE